MRIFSTVIFCITLLYALSSCSGIQSHSFKADGVDLKKYKTYAWVKPANAEDSIRNDDKLYASLILQLTNDELAKKGFTLNTEQPDAVFTFNTRVEDRVSYTQTPQVSVGVGFGGPGYYGSMYAPVTGGDYVPHNYQQGVLFIEMYDTKTQKMVWSGWAEDKLTYKSNVERVIRIAVKHIFMRLPVKHK